MQNGKWTLLILMGSVFSVDCSTFREKLAHGSRLTVELPTETESLEFVPADGSPGYTIWKRLQHSPSKGRLTGSIQNDHRWELPQVTFDDEGSYNVLNYWNKKSKVVLLAVQTAYKYIDRVAGEDLIISLEGSRYQEANLFFSGEYGNLTLVWDGSPAAENNPDYDGRVKVRSSGIALSHVNVSDVGRYNLTDRRGRVVSITKMTLVDAHDFSADRNFLSLLALLGIPVGICYCCKKRRRRNCFKKSRSCARPVPNTRPSNTPTVPPPSYNDPSNTSGLNYTPVFTGDAGYPPQPAMPPGPGLNTGDNPIYPPVYPPTHPPQWTSDQYNPTSYTPLMPSNPTPASAVNIEMKSTLPADPLSVPQGQEALGPTSDPLQISNTPAQFQIDMGKNNFL
ncbi:uncharacterized protein LOC114788678 [Denticeps clupeoides]|uniref:Uncharacterized protein n=1 Tax=Denticeps clupeoides TaxID=299321 RepID=A0A8C4BPC8_9TELE|nr:uncharacterized protein LOC114788678 [Denticeps clupeoides]